MTLGEAITDVLAELARAEAKFGAFRSNHEGYAVLLEEMDELWDGIKRKPRDMDRVRSEAVQVTVIGLKFLLCCGEPLEETNET